MNVLITAGPTREYLDDVRYLSNASTGHMACALAEAAQAAGHQVTVVAGPIEAADPPGAKVVRVISAREMLDAVAAEFPKCDVFIACAAVSDYRPARRASGKIKRQGAERLTLDLVRNPDILHEMASRRRPGQIVIGFALETADGEANARDKLVRKQLDAIVLNPPDAIGAAETEITIFRSGGAAGEAFRGAKAEAARHIIALAEALSAETD